MSKIYYRYNGSSYEQTNPQKAAAPSTQIGVICLIVMVVALAVICLTLNLVITRSAERNSAIEDDYNMNSVNEQYGTSSPTTTPGSSESGSAGTSEGPFVPTGAPVAIKPYGDEKTEYLSGVDSQYAVVLDASTGHIIASRNSEKKIYPASMTKVMSAIVAYEYMLNNNIDIMSTYLSVSPAILNYIYVEGASSANFQKGEQVRIHDVFHGLILPSGADATLMLAEFCYGSEEEFVNVMNNKAIEMGLKNTHFVTSTGLHRKDHYSTVSDFAVILAYACEYDYLKEIMTLTSYQYAETNMNGPRSCVSTLYNWRRYYSTTLSKSLVEGAVDFGGKSGYTPEAKYCLCTFAEGGDGKLYIAVSAYASTRPNIVADYLYMFKQYCDLKAY